jgi:hypothetical protein
MTVRSDAVVSLKRHGVANGSTQGKAGLAGEVENPPQQRRRNSEPRAKQRQETPDARQLGTAGQVTGECALRNCPQWVAYEESLHETIAVLQKTKTVSASKELKTLREKLEALLKNARLT